MTALSEPVTVNILVEQERRRTVEADCPVCGKASQVIGVDHCEESG